MQKKPRGRYQKLEDELERSNQEYIENQQHQQQVFYINLTSSSDIIIFPVFNCCLVQVIMVQQDKQLDRVGDTMTVLHQMGTDIGIELDEQNK